MNIFKKTAIAAAAIIATAIVPTTGAFAQVKSAPAHGYHHAHKGGPNYYKKGPRVHYPRGYYKQRPPVVVKQNRGNAAAAGILGFAAGALVGSALSK
ncbi:MAG: hypothetical protein AAGC96_10755 [Pseudomonadota bacterium]